MSIDILATCLPLEQLILLAGCSQAGDDDALRFISRAALPGLCVLSILGRQQLEPRNEPVAAIGLKSGFEFLSPKTEEERVEDVSGRIRRGL